ncbi:hypothetical protein [Tenacibaculum jejuense]|uniref:hypothetical protein n=1 Tax=Tenacibaculum jejuense TaxID=584609 RepID=UPI000BA4CA2A|nr:hypothetical protein [Tenacibaculum jejuense]
MKKSISTLGKVITKEDQLSIKGGRTVSYEETNGICFKIVYKNDGSVAKLKYKAKFADRC